MAKQGKSGRQQKQTEQKEQGEKTDSLQEDWPISIRTLLEIQEMAERIKYRLPAKPTKAKND